MMCEAAWWKTAGFISLIETTELLVFILFRCIRIFQEVFCEKMELSAVN